MTTARNALQKVDRYLEARAALGTARKNSNNSETMRKLEAAERHAASLLTAAADDLRDALEQQGGL